MKILSSSLRAASAVPVWALALTCGLLWTTTAVGGPTVLTQKQVPITITKSGSYVLGGNLNVTNPTVDAILVLANDVTIDLGGFTIEGPLQGPTSNGSAIDTPGGQQNIVVKNGTIRGFYEYAKGCINLDGEGHRVENVHLISCGWTAIYVAGVATRCVITDSRQGIHAGSGSVITDNQLFAVQMGMYLHPGVTVARNTLYTYGDGWHCIDSAGASRIEENTCHGYLLGLRLTGLTDGANFYARNVIYGAEEPLVDAGPPNIDGGTIDPALSNVIVPETP